MNKSRIYVVGMPGSGKSTLGKALAEKINYSFIDLDTEIEQLEGRSIPTIFEGEGEAYFRQLEKDVLYKVIPENTVIATGGGAPCFFDNMNFIKENGYSIFIDVSVDHLAERVLSQKGTRPLLNHAEDFEEARKSLSEKYEARKSFYLRSDLHLMTKTYSVAELVALILEEMK